MHLCVHNSSISVHLCSFSSKIRMVLRVAGVNFRDQKEHSRAFILQLRPPKDIRPSLLRTSREHTMEYMWHTMESPSSLGSPSTMYQEREGWFEFSYKRPPRDEQYENTLLCWPEFPQAIQQCVIRSKDRGNSIVGHPTTPVHHSRERETLRQGNSEVKTSLHQDLELHSSKDPLASG